MSRTIKKNKQQSAFNKGWESPIGFENPYLEGTKHYQWFEDGKEAFWSYVVQKVKKDEGRKITVDEAKKGGKYYKQRYISNNK